jgi:hypothetical protein
VAEISFFATDKDHREFVGFLIERFSARFSQDDVSTANPPWLTTVKDVCEAIESNRFGARFAVVSELWQKYPLYRNFVIRKSGERCYYINQRYGGPAFDFIARRNRTEGGVRFIIPSLFSDYPYYYPDDDSTTYRTFNRPAPMAKAYGDVQKYIRRFGMRTDVKNISRPGPWALHDALQGYKKGIWLRTGEWIHIPRSNK